MKIRISLFAGAFGLLFMAIAAFANAAIPIYSNDLKTTASRSQLVKHEGAQCKRGGSKAAFRVTLGADTQACSYRPPVVGRDLEIAVTGRVLSGTPAKVRGRSYLAVGLRAGDGGVLTVRVFPVQGKLQLIKYDTDGSSRYLAIVKKNEAIRGVNQANRIYLRAFNQGAPGHCWVVVRVNGKRLVAQDVDRCAMLSGRDTVIEAGATRAGEGLIASFNKLRIGVPDPFAT